MVLIHENEVVHKNHLFVNQSSPIALYGSDLLKRTVHKNNLVMNWTTLVALLIILI